MPNLSEFSTLVLRVQRQCEQDAVGRNRYGAASLQIVIFWHSHLPRVPVVVHNAESVNATLIDVLASVPGHTSYVERHDVAESSVLRGLL